MKISCIDIGGTYIKSGVLEDGVLTDVEETPTDFKLVHWLKVPSNDVTSVLSAKRFAGILSKEVHRANVVEKFVTALHPLKRSSGICLSNPHSIKVRWKETAFVQFLNNPAGILFSFLQSPNV